MSLKYALKLHKVQNIVDERIFPLVCGVLGFFKRKGELPKHPKRILFIRFSGLGDAIQSLPTIKRLHERYPRAKITVLCVPRNREAFQNQKFISGVKVMGRKDMLFSMPFYAIRSFRSFDLCIDTETGFRLAAILSFFLSKRTVGFSYKEGDWLYDVSIKANAAEHGVPRLAHLLMARVAKGESGGTNRAVAPKRLQNRAHRPVFRLNNCKRRNGRACRPDKCLRFL
ncbi:MAG: hypothetical protein NTV88_03810 [Candidatus Micrarchaeota archaeon]|nr:hypothetical protein [Candidatus Micrarchaeota archaeon]